MCRTSTRSCCCARRRAPRCSCSNSAEACVEPSASRSAPCSTSSDCIAASSASTCGTEPCSAAADTTCSSSSNATSRSSRRAATSSSIRSPGTSCSRASGTRSRPVGPSASPSCDRSATSRCRRSSTQSGLELDDIYANNRSWTRAATGRRHADRARRRRRDAAAASRRPPAACRRRRAASPATATSRRRRAVIDVDALDERGRRLLRMFLASMFTDAPQRHLEAALGARCGPIRRCVPSWPSCSMSSTRRSTTSSRCCRRSPHVPLHLHARYTRIEIQAAFNDGTALRPPRWDSGVKWLPHEQTDVFAFTLDKTSGEFSPTTRYQDYAISPELIHWESQSTTSVRARRAALPPPAASKHQRGLVRPPASRRPRLLVPRPGHLRPPRGRPSDRDHLAAAHRLPADLYTAFAAAVA